MQGLKRDAGLQHPLRVGKAGDRLSEAVGLQAGPARAPAIAQGEAGPVAAVAALGIQIPALAALPDGVLQGLLHLPVLLAIGVRIDFHAAGAAAPQGCQTAHHMRDLAFQHVDDGVVTQIGVGAIQHEEVGKTRHGHAEIGAGPFAPDGVEVDAIASGNAHRRQKLGGGKAGAVHQHIGGVQRAVFGFHTVRMDAADRCGDQRDVGPRHGGQVVAGEQDALAADRIVRREPGTQGGIGHLFAQHVPERASHRRLHQALEAGKGERAGLVLQVDFQAVQKHAPGLAGKARLFIGAVGAIGPRQDVGR